MFQTHVCEIGADRCASMTCSKILMLAGELSQARLYPSTSFRLKPVPESLNSPDLPTARRPPTKDDPTMVFHWDSVMAKSMQGGNPQQVSRPSIMSKSLHEHQSASNFNVSSSDQEVSSIPRMNKKGSDQKRSSSAATASTRRTPPTSARPLHDLKPSPNSRSKKSHVSADDDDDYSDDSTADMGKKKVARMNGKRMSSSLSRQRKGMMPVPMEGVADDRYKPDRYHSSSKTRRPTSAPVTTRTDNKPRTSSSTIPPTNRPQQYLRSISHGKLLRPRSLKLHYV